jgi:L-fuculose-phosphate aldolase
MTLEDARRLALEACLQLAAQGFLAGTGGNLAVRAEGGLFVVTPSGRDYYSMVPADLCVLRLDCLKQVDGPYPPSVEAGLHARMLRQRPDVAASVHTHQPLASAAALVGEPVPVAGPEDRLHLGPQLALVPYGPSGTFLLSRAFGRRIRPDLNAYLLRNHGLVCAGGDLAAAVANAARVERICAGFLRDAIQMTGTGSPAARFALANLNPS